MLWRSPEAPLLVGLREIRLLFVCTYSRAEHGAFCKGYQIGASIGVRRQRRWWFPGSSVLSTSDCCSQSISPESQGLNESSGGKLCVCSGGNELKGSDPWFELDRCDLIDQILVAELNGPRNPLFSPLARPLLKMSRLFNLPCIFVIERPFNAIALS